MSSSKQKISVSASASLPTIYGRFQIKIYRSNDPLEHTALIKGQDAKGTAMVRIHSSCLMGESFASLRCDCHDQLIKGLKIIGKSKKGVLIYLDQEGRGIGLSNHIKTYALQEKGLDTVQANEQLGFAADPRSYELAAQILKDLKIQRINLLTNNPDKAIQLKNFGITIVSCIPLEIAPNKINKSYLKTKKYKLGHKLKLV